MPAVGAPPAAPDGPGHAVRSVCEGRRIEQQLPKARRGEGARVPGDEQRIARRVANQIGPRLPPTPTRPDAETLSTLTAKFGRPTATMPTWSAASRNLKIVGCFAAIQAPNAFFGRPETRESGTSVS